MPRYFSNKREQLFAEACASFLLIQEMANNAPCNSRIEKILRNAQKRSCRRWQAFLS